MRVLPGTFQNPNHCQESGSSTALTSLTMASMSNNFHRRQPGGPGYGLAKTGACLLSLLCAILWAGRAASAQGATFAGPQTTEPHITLAIFADHRMEDRQWTALESALRSNLAEAVAESRATAGIPEIVRGDAVMPGVRLEKAIVVHLHGECNLVPLPKTTTDGLRLGWVLMAHGRIQPYIHVDCSDIGQVLGPQAWGEDRDRRNSVMAGAIARVILHEWIHIATQSPAHAERGLGKAQFGVADLMPGDGQPAARSRNPW